MPKKNKRRGGNGDGQQGQVDQPEAAAAAGGGKGGAGRGGKGRAEAPVGELPPWVCLAFGCVPRGKAPYCNYGRRLCCYNCGAAKPVDSSSRGKNGGGKGGGNAPTPPCPTTRKGGGAGAAGAQAAGGGGGGKASGGKGGGGGGPAAGADTAKGKGGGKDGAADALAVMAKRAEDAERQVAELRAAAAAAKSAGTVAAEEPPVQADMDGLVEQDQLQGERLKEVEAKIKEVGTDLARHRELLRAHERIFGESSEDAREHPHGFQLYREITRLTEGRNLLLAEKAELQPTSAKRKRLAGQVGKFRADIARWEKKQQKALDAGEEAKRVYDAAAAAALEASAEAAGSVLHFKGALAKAEADLAALGGAEEDEEASLVAIPPQDQEVVDLYRKQGREELAEEYLQRARAKAAAATERIPPAPGAAADATLQAEPPVITGTGPGAGTAPPPAPPPVGVAAGTSPGTAPAQNSAAPAAEGGAGVEGTATDVGMEQQEGGVLPTPVPAPAATGPAAGVSASAAAPRSRLPGTTARGRTAAGEEMADKKARARSRSGPEAAGTTA